ncbi:MAG: hypothetical protein LBI29_04590, partial [Rickettsiales bacterium]|nr:hypothetical protein [Rickettsiales bacterium]
MKKGGEDYFRRMLWFICRIPLLGLGSFFLFSQRCELWAEETKEYLDCQNTALIKEVTSKESLDSLQEKYIKLLQPPSASNMGELFVPLKKSGDLEEGFLTCDFTSGSIFECESSRLWSSSNSGCTETTKIDGVDVEITDCAKFDIQNEKGTETTTEKKACYPQNHICNKYREDIFNNYYGISSSYFENGTTGKIVIYKKNVVSEGGSKNCSLVKFPCDFRLKNESPGDGKNIVFKDSTSASGKKFIANILAGLGNKAFFKLTGSCRKSDGAACTNILNGPHYYKYVNGTSLDSGTTIYYFKKNIDYSNMGILCNKYLPICQDMDIGDNFSKALYNNSDSDNNFGSRKSFYSDAYKDKVQEENLWFTNNNNFINYICLSVSKNGDGSADKDIGYCSDLNENMDNLKYPNGLETMGQIANGALTKVPNCYLKSCSDLTPDELSKIVANGKRDKKYCSEYYWLSNPKGFKYFPKENPPYCSNVETVSGKGNQLVFRENIYEYAECNTGADGSPITDSAGNCTSFRNDKTYYSYGGGLSKERDNCYLKNCYSLSSGERKLVAEARFTSIGFELERAYGLQGGSGIETTYNASNIPVYCDNGFLFVKDVDGFSDFDYLNLNLIPCFELSPEQLKAMTTNIGMILFTDILKSYNTNNVYKFCRTHYIPLDRIGGDYHDKYTLFLETMISIANEINKVVQNSEYSAYFAKSTLGDLGTYNSKKASDSIFGLAGETASNYRKVSFSHSSLNSFTEKVNYGNVCKYVDNNFLYYNADLESYNTTRIKNNKKLSNVLGRVKRKNTSYAECLDGATADNSKPYNPVDSNTPDECKNCVTADDQGKCLYEIDNCKVYAYNYGCKKDHCSGDSLKYCEEEDKVIEKIVDCGKYKAESGGGSENYLDCRLYYSANTNEKKIFEDFKNAIGSDKIDTIKTACDAMMPIVDSRPEVVPDTLSKLIKPYKTSGSSSGAGSSSPAKSDLERYGCIKFDAPSDNYGLYGCKIPGDNSSYITGSLTSSTAINGMDLNSFSKPKDAKIKLNVCSRYPKDVTKDGNCGNREGSVYSDKCVNIGDSGEATLEDTSDNFWFLSESSGGSRFRTENRTKRDILVFRDFHTYHYCYSDKKREFDDGASAAIISGEGAIIGGTVALAVCPASCAGSLLFFLVCTGVCSAITIGVSIGISLGVRSDQWKINLQNDLQIARGYNSVEGYEEKGFIGKAFITDNNNYMYRFYPRYESIEDDLKSKLENNLSGENRFFHGNTTGSEIIKKCKIGKLFEDENSCAGGNECDYKYVYNKLNEDGSSSETCSETNPSNCLHETQKACLNAYGVSFMNNSNIDEDFLTRTGGFLKKFTSGDILKDGWGKSSNKDDRNYVPVEIVYFTKDKQTQAALQANEKCKLGAYGDPIDDLSRCRGFEHNGVFYTESQMAKMPLLTSPFLFYTLITPRNTPELFDPTLIIINYYHFSNLNSAKDYNLPSDVILDFFNPKIKFDYSFLGGVSDPDFVNTLANQNNFTTEIKATEDYSYPHILKYKSNSISERDYKYVLHKTYNSGIHDEFIPVVCVYKIMAMPENGTENIFLDLETCSGTGCLTKSEGHSFIVVDNNVACYPRRPLELKEFILKPDEGITYKKSFINVYIRPAGKTYNELKGNVAYEFRKGDSIQIEDKGENTIQGFGLNFTRSYCSKIYRDYYIYLDQIARERVSPNKDIAKINRLAKNIQTIESTIIPDCSEEDGVASDVLINAPAMKTFKETDGVADKIVSKQTARIIKYSESYGGHNEVCVSDPDINKIFELRKQFGMGGDEMPKVLVFKDKANRKLKTKCVLNSLSMSNEKCLVANTVYIYCGENEAGCQEVLNIDTFEKVLIRTINCRNYLGQGINENNIKYIQACFRGGFNSSKNIYDKNGNEESSCACRTISSGEFFEESLFSSRVMTSREYGLCVDLEKPTICPAVRYYDSSKKYSDDGLALDKTEDELMEGEIGDYEQHIWRTDEMQVGILPAVFYSRTLGHAEFPASVYCSVDKPPYENDEDKNEKYFDENCIGGKKTIEGECIGFWKQNGENAPQAICTVRDRDDGTTLYEYELLKAADVENSSTRNKYECIRYNCPGIGYDDLNHEVVDEKDIDDKTANMFTAMEINSYANVLLTDYRSFSHNEERDSRTVDSRGSTNGFAIWKDTVSSDFAQLVTSSQCLTGFAPAQTSYNIKLGTEYDSDTVNYDDIESNYDKVLTLYREQKEKADSKSSLMLPKRRCNQKGRWLTVQDIYNGGLINKSDPNNNYYYDDPDNFWMTVLANDPNSGATDNPDKYGDRYCERLVCRAMETKNENIYL